MGTKSRTLSVGGQLDGTQDRNIQQNFTLDMSALLHYGTNKDGLGFPCKNPDTFGVGISGYLGLAKVIKDGLRSVDLIKDYNLYGTAGASPLSALSLPSLVGTTNGQVLSGPVKFSGILSPAPTLGPNAPPQQVTLSGIMTPDPDDSSWSATLNLSGNIFPIPSGGAQQVVVTGTILKRTVTGGIAVTPLQATFQIHNFIGLRNCSAVWEQQQFGADCSAQQ
jgi:hypothetical protein